MVELQLDAEVAVIGLVELLVFLFDGVKTLFILSSTGNRDPLVERQPLT